MGTQTAIERGVCLVTGAAGFIGSHLANALVARGYVVRGVDAFVDSYPRACKERNLEQVRGAPNYQFVEADLRRADMRALLQGVDSVFHEAAQAGVRSSWSDGFPAYVEHNILVTQRLLEAATHAGLRRVVLASSSSVYGDAPERPSREDGRVAPVSPYGVTKLAAEQLARVYAVAYTVPAIALRYFTVYGPRQRPDMAIHRFIRAILLDEPITVYGDGEQTRDFTYVGDIVGANLVAMHKGAIGASYNIGGGSYVTVNRVLELPAEITGQQPQVRYAPRQRGDAPHTLADNQAAKHDLAFAPAWTLEQGLRREVEWLREELARSHEHPHPPSSAAVAMAR